MNELDDIRGQIDTAAGQVDATTDQAYAAVAKQLSTIGPEASGMVLQMLPPVLSLMGGKLEGEPTTLGDPAVVRALSAVADATEDAAVEGVIDQELAIHLEALTDDTGAQLLAGQLRSLAGHKDFKAWLKRPVEPPKPAAAPKAPGKPAPTKEAEDDFFASRLGKGV